MGIAEISRREYISRINRVKDYIDDNLREPLSINQIASIAGFSPFHFHRIFSALCGETLNGYIRRIRAEKAARMLISFPEMPVVEISELCGYTSMSVFCRTFKDIFGVNAGDFRTKKTEEVSKIRQSLSKKSQFSIEEDSDLCFIKPNEERKQFMKTNIEVKTMPALKLLYVRHTGAFDQIGMAYGKLMQWAGPRGLLQSPNFKTATVYHDDPAITKIENLRQSACITIDRDVKGEGEIGRLDLPANLCAVGRFEIGVDGFSDAWNTMCLWLTESGFQPGEGLPYELYYNNQEEHPEKKFILDICIPVKKL
ncbi:MAG: AraC family transcriptional regulator [Bacteroidetes bacterium HGW-Bacteroidetes-6]|jgi:AraC family transcriptional regulator|nr:MAG: AraC family transcriptional regulator [Bacteroidetes bacterium HGW-Bacteroidetes-6]